MRAGRPVSVRPGPTAGGANALTVYVLIHRCEGLEPGLYRYDASAHALHLVSTPSHLTRTLLRSAAHTAATRTPQVLVIMSAEFAKLNARYASVAYALILKDVGVLMQTMCLVAAAMNLAACPLGGGNADLFTEATGTGYFDETSVGELILGSSGGAS